MTTRKRPPSGNGFSLGDPEEKVPEVETVFKENLTEQEEPVKIEVVEVKPEGKVEAPRLEMKPKPKPPEKKTEPEVHINPEPNKVGQLIRPRRNVPRFVK